MFSWPINIIFTVIGLCIGMKFGKALKSGLFVGVGFVGLGVVTALLTTNFNDPLKALKIESIANTTSAMTREADNTTIAL